MMNFCKVQTKPWICKFLGPPKVVTQSVTQGVSQSPLAEIYIRMLSLSCILTDFSTILMLRKAMTWHVQLLIRYSHCCSYLITGMRQSLAPRHESKTFNYSVWELLHNGCKKWIMNEGFQNSFILFWKYKDKIWINLRF